MTLALRRIENVLRGLVERILDPSLGPLWQSTTGIAFLTVLEPGTPRSRCQQIWCLLGPLSLACQRPPSSYDLIGSSITLCCLCPNLLPIRTHLGLGASPIWPHLTSVTSLKAPSPNSHTEVLKVRISACEFWGGGGTIWSMTLSYSSTVSSNENLKAYASPIGGLLERTGVHACNRTRDNYLKRDKHMLTNVWRCSRDADE